MIRAVIFDRAGTLVRERPGEEVLREILHPMGYERPAETYKKAETASRRRWREKYQGLPRGHRWSREVRRDCLQAALEVLALPGDQEELLARLDEQWDALRVHGLYGGVLPCLGALAASRIPMGVLAQTLRSSLEVRAELERLGVGRYFGAILSVEDTEWDKPDPKLFRAVADRLERPVSEVLFVGDDLAKDIVGARSAGMFAVLVDRHGATTAAGVTSVTTLAQIPALLNTLG